MIVQCTGTKINPPSLNTTPPLSGGWMAEAREASGHYQARRARVISVSVTAVPLSEGGQSKVHDPFGKVCRSDQHTQSAWVSTLTAASDPHSAIDTEGTMQQELLV